MRVGAIDESRTGYVEQGSTTDSVAQLGRPEATEESSVYFNMDEMRGFAIVDSGAKESMGGIEQMEWLQEPVAALLGENPSLIDEKATTKFTYTKSTKGSSYGRAGVPHSLALESRESQEMIHDGPGGQSDIAGVRLSRSCGNRHGV